MEARSLQVIAGVVAMAGMKMATNKKGGGDEEEKKGGGDEEEEKKPKAPKKQAAPKKEIKLEDKLWRCFDERLGKYMCGQYLKITQETTQGVYMARLQRKTGDMVGGTIFVTEHQIEDIATFHEPTKWKALKITKEDRVFLDEMLDAAELEVPHKWGSGTYYGDASGGEYTRYPQLRRIGVAVVFTDTNGNLQYGLHVKAL